jgi:spore germination protein YaaH
MFERVFSKLRPVIAALMLMLALALCLTSRTWIGAPANYFWQTSTIQTLPAPSVSTSRLLNGKLASLGWIVGRDCQRGIRAYLQTASTNPDAALVGTGWVDPTSGKLINGESNNCVPGSLSMDNVVQLVHSKGGMAYLTITMETDGSAQAWTSQQQSDYIAKATTDQSFLDPIIHEVTRVHYDGVIMDMEGGDRTYPNIQQLFSTYNQRVWAALKPLHKLYGIALIHKLSNQDDYYNLNGFENWSLLAHCADFIVIMAVDQSYFTPGPTVSIPWLKQLLAYALHTMPAMLPHIIWELPLYGATWHWDGSNWVFDGGANYQDAQVLTGQIPASEIDTSSSNLNDPYAAHIVYTDTSGVKHALWYHTAKNLYRIITEFQRILEQVPQFNHSHLQIAVWYRATWEPGDLWAMLDPVLSN